jgi:tetratricopeptide (TPR) repeat protein
MLNQVSSYCIACHTRNNSGPSFASLPLEPLSKNLSPLEQAKFYAATRQYDRALDIFQKILNDPVAPIERPLEWEQAIRYGLSIAVRVKQDPDQARALVERVIGAKNSPFFLKQDALKWKDSIIQWKDETPKKAMTEEGLFSQATQLIVQARELQKYPRDHLADVLYLRASAVIHELLQKVPDGHRAQEALLMAGMCYDILRPLGLEGIHEIYYDACIKKAPHTATSETCYRRYEQSTYEGFTGSAGTYLPDDIKQKLQKLEGLAHPEGAQTPG